MELRFKQGIEVGNCHWSLATGCLYLGRPLKVLTRGKKLATLTRNTASNILMEKNPKKVYSKNEIPKHPAARGKKLATLTRNTQALPLSTLR